MGNIGDTNFLMMFASETFSLIDEKFDVLINQCIAELENEGFKRYMFFKVKLQKSNICLFLFIFY